MTEVILDVGPVAHGGHFVARLEGKAEPGKAEPGKTSGDISGTTGGEIGDETSGGAGGGAGGSTGRSTGGRVVFVRHALPGERVRAVLTESAEGDPFWRADVVEVLRESAEYPDARVPHFWPDADSLAAHAGGRLPVGGAEFGHISLPVQRALKSAVLAEQLRRLAKLDLNVVVEEVPGEDPQGLGWRTRTGFAVTEQGELGMHAHRSDQILPVQDMPLAVRRIRALGWWGQDFSGLERVEVAAPTSGDGPLVLLAGAKQASSRVAKSLPDGVSALHWDPKSSRVSALRGRPWLDETVGELHFRVSGDGFWQIHRRAPEVLSAAVKEYLSETLLPGSMAADLYAGAGLFTALLADAVGPTGRVLSIEGSSVTSKDAARNFADRAEVLVRPGRVERVLAVVAREERESHSGNHSESNSESHRGNHSENHRGNQSESHSGSDAGPRVAKLDAVVLDPPRAGAGKNVVRQVCASGARAVVYVSCDPASFARDVGYFAGEGWELVELRAFDLYPHTHHLETVALLRPRT